MEYNIAFEITEVSKFHYYTAAGVFAGLFIIAFSVFLGTFGTAVHSALWKPLISFLFSAVFLYFAVQLSISTTKMINDVYGCYEQGDAQIVEGTVENCDTKHFYKNGRGSFTVDGVKFDYGHTVGLPSYRGKNNLIQENGQNVKIHYIPYSNQNLIVKIEICD
ncbi:MAG: hypothetical protein II984_11320 [Clostridia bacterium]|nr:hypothetical protein [Clostridia bacterium]